MPEQVRGKNISETFWNTLVLEAEHLNATPNPQLRGVKHWIQCYRAGHVCVHRHIGGDGVVPATDAVDAG